MDTHDISECKEILKELCKLPIGTELLKNDSIRIILDYDGTKIYYKKSYDSEILGEDAYEFARWADEALIL